MKLILKSLYQNSRNEEIKELIFCAFNKNYHIRSYVAENPNTPIPIIERLSNDKAWQVRYYIAQNQNTPVHILKKLSEDENTTVYYYAILNIKNI